MKEKARTECCGPDRRSESSLESEPVSILKLEAKLASGGSGIPRIEMNRRNYGYE